MDPDQTRTRIFLCGDIMLARGLDQMLPRPGDPELREAHSRSALDYVALARRANGPFQAHAGFTDVWGAALAEWRAFAPDVRLANLETSVTRSDDFAAKGINYRTTPENAACLADAGFDACSLANNHVLDFGPGGLLETLQTLKALGIRTAGAGATLDEAEAPAVIPLPGKEARVIFAGVAFGDSGVPPAWRARPNGPGVCFTQPGEDAARALAARIARARRPGDIGIASIHWGSNWGWQVRDAHRRFAHALIDTGQVSIVHGHSSHHPRPAEVYRGRLILYGCGDFLNDYEGIGGYEEFRSEIVAMYFADVGRNGDVTALALAPLAIRRFRLDRATTQEAAWLRETLTRESRPFGVTFEPADRGRMAARWKTQP